MGGSVSKDEGGTMEMVGATFSWKVENYSKIPREKWLKSPIFTVAGQPYFLQLYKDSNLQIVLNSDQKSAVPLRFRCRISLVDSKGLERYTRVTEMAIENEKEGYVLFKIPECDVIKHRNRIIPQDTLTIFFNGTIMSDDGSLVPLREDRSMFLETLSTDLGTLYDRKLNSDVVLGTGNVSFHAHRAVLSARSTVFAAMFQHDTLEKQKGKVEILDVEARIVEDMLHYIYTGKIRVQNAKTSILMYYAADKYALPELKEECRKNIIATLTTESICEATLLADTFQEESIKKAVVGLLRENRTEILEDELWMSFAVKQPRLTNDILSSALIADKKK